jgi:glycosyltransferase involved in cell wall biosynthesis
MLQERLRGVDILERPGNSTVSCLMVTMPTANRFPMLQRSIDAYCNQTYIRRELVIVIDSISDTEAHQIRAYVTSLKRYDIRVVVPSKKLSLGALRNLSWREAIGDYICQWDDDDLSHPSRIELQLSALRSSGKQACYLQEFMQYFVCDRSLYKLNFAVSPDRVAVNTLMCLRKLSVSYPESGPDSARGEDKALVTEIQGLGGYHALAGMPHLYVYVSHGANTWDDSHHRMLADKMAVSRGLLKRYEAELRAGLAPFDFGAQSVTVTGQNGDAFTLHTRP